jgi:hypothetical protein
MSIRSASNLVASAQLAGGGGGRLIWEWNGTDVSQLGDGDGTPNAVVGSPTGSLAAAVLGYSGYDEPTDNVLKYTHTGSTSTTAFYIINDLPELPERFIVQVKMGPRESTLSPNTSPRLVLAYQDPTHHMTWSNNGASSDLLVAANGSDGVTALCYTSGISEAQYESGSIHTVDCTLGEPSSGVDPRMSFFASNPNGNLFVRASNSGWSSVGGATCPNSSWDSGWQTGGTIRRVGIAFDEKSSAGSAWVTDLKIYGV